MTRQLFIIKYNDYGFKDQPSLYEKFIKDFKYNKKEENLKVIKFNHCIAGFIDTEDGVVAIRIRLINFIQKFQIKKDIDRAILFMHENKVIRVMPYLTQAIDSREAYNDIINTYINDSLVGIIAG